MLRPFALIALASVPFLALVPQQSGSSLAPQPVFLCDSLDQNPVLMFDVSGYTLTGLLTLHMSVYDNGATSISSVSGGGGSSFPQSMKADHAFVSPIKVKQLATDLANAGAHRLCDEHLFVSDIPMTTVTVFKGGMNAKAHTYNYWFPMSPASQNVATIIEKFKQDTFPNF